MLNIIDSVVFTFEYITLLKHAKHATKIFVFARKNVPVFHFSKSGQPTLDTLDEIHDGRLKIQ